MVSLLITPQNDDDEEVENLKDIDNEIEKYLEKEEGEDVFDALVDNPSPEKKAAKKR